MNTHAAKRTRLTFILVGVLALLIGIIGWMEFGQQIKTTQDANAIQHIVINRTGHPAIEIVHEQSNWRMTKPYSLNANAQRIEPLLALGSATFDGYNTSEVDMAATGLASPGASMILGGREFLLGNTDASGDRRYALVDGKVSFVPEWVWSLLHGGTTAFAELAVFNGLSENVYLKSDNSPESKPGSAELWQALQADKILPWPVENAQVLGAQSTDGTHTLHSSSAISDSNKLADIIEYQDVTVIITQPGFAFAISNERMRKLLYL